MEKDLRDFIMEDGSLPRPQAVIAHHAHQVRHHYWACADCGHITISEIPILPPAPCGCGSIAFNTVWTATTLK